MRFWQDSENILHVCQIVKPTPHLRLAVGSGGVSEAPSPASKAGKLAQAASSSHKVTMTQYQRLRFICSLGHNINCAWKFVSWQISAHSWNNTQQFPTLPHQVTEYFPIRRSERKPKGELLKEQMEGIEARLLSTDDSTLDIKISMIENKGRGIVSKRAFSKGEFIVEYAGELISDEESKARWAVVEPCNQVLTFELQGVEIPAGHQQGELHVLVQAQGNRVLVCVQEWVNQAAIANSTPFQILTWNPPGSYPDAQILLVSTLLGRVGGMEDFWITAWRNQTVLQRYVFRNKRNEILALNIPLEGGDVGEHTAPYIGGQARHWGGDGVALRLWGQE